MKFQNSIKSVKFLLDKEIQFSVHVKPFNFVLCANKLELGHINRNTRTGNVKIFKPFWKMSKNAISYSKKFKNSEIQTMLFLKYWDLHAQNAILAKNYKFYPLKISKMTFLIQNYTNVWASLFLPKVVLSLVIILISFFGSVWPHSYLGHLW